MNNTMDRIAGFIEEKLSPAFGAFADLPLVASVARAFTILMPINLLGAFAVLFFAIPLPSLTSFLATSGLLNLLGIINNLTLGSLALYVAGSMSYQYANRLGMKDHSFILIFIGLYAFLLATPYETIEGANYFSLGNFGAKSIFAALIIAVLSVRVYQFCIKKKIYIKMPKGVPAYIETSFAGLVPTLFISIIILGLNVIIQNFGYGSVTELIYAMIAAPLLKFASGNPAVLIFIMWLPGIFWFFGIHGANATNAIIQPILGTMALENAAAYAAGEAMPHLITQGTMAIGANLSVIWCIFLLTSKHKRFKELGKLALIPSCFGVSEPTQFGIPTVLNPYLAIPVVFYPLIANIIKYFVTLIGLLPAAHNVYTWGLPIFMGSFVQAGIPGVIFEAVMYVFYFVASYPFFKAYEKVTIANETSEEE